MRYNKCWLTLAATLSAVAPNIWVAINNDSTHQGVVVVPLLVPSLLDGGHTSVERHDESNKISDHAANRILLDTFTAKPDTSILSYLNPSILANQNGLAEMRENLSKGNLVVIKNAFQPEFAEYVWRSYNDYNESEWELFAVDPGKSRPWYHPGSNFHFHDIPSARKHKNRKSAIASDIFNHQETLDFMANLSGIPAVSEGSFYKGSPSLYKPGDYANFHSDLVGHRAITLLWQLSKNWDPSWGGAFYWTAASKKLENAYRHSEFNTLILFSVSAVSHHAVTPVTSKATTGKRLTYAGWFYSSYNKLSMKDPLEEMYSTKEARKNLTNSQALWLSGVKVRDPKRRRRMQTLKESILSERIYPEVKEPIFVIDKRGEEQNTTSGHESDNEKPFEIGRGSSIIDYLNPDIFEDEDMRAKIRNELRSGNLVVIRDAFVRDFALHVMQDLSRPSYAWTEFQQFVNDDILGFSKRNSIGTEMSSKTTRKTIDVFNHRDTKRLLENLSGKDCSGKIKATAELYQPGDYSDPDNGWRSDHTVSFMWSLTKNWKESMGGSLYWMSARNTFEAYQDMHFNSLFLFNVGETTSSHAVSVVTTDSSPGGNVLSFRGHFTSTIRTTSIADPVEEWYATKEDRLRLSAGEANKIVYELNAESLVDVDRKRRIKEIQTAVREEIIEPEIEDENLYVLIA